MATLEKSRRKVKKEKRVKACAPNLDCEEENSRPPQNTLREECDTEKCTSVLEKKSDTFQASENVAPTRSYPSAGENARPASECKESRGTYAGADIAHKSPTHETCQHESHAQTIGIGNVDSATHVPERIVQDRASKFITPSSITTGLNVSSTESSVSSKICSTSTDHKDEVNLTEHESVSQKNCSSKDNHGLQGSSRGIVKETKETVSGKSGSSAKNANRVIDSKKFPTENKFKNIGDLKSLNEEKADLGIVGVVQPSSVRLLPSAPCDISIEDDFSNRIRCLEETSLRSLCPLTVFRIVYPSDSVIKNHPLYVLLCDYLRSCRHLSRSLKKHETLVEKTEQLRETIWSITEEEVIQSGKCKDEALLIAKYSRSMAVKDDRQLSLLGSSLSGARETLHSECALHIFDSETQRLRVEHFIQAEEEAQAIVPSAEEVRVCVVILFYFIQHQNSNSAFIFKVQSWLLRLGRVLLQVATPSDHLLLLSQLLQCPKGVSSWGKPLVQFDPPPHHTSLQSIAKLCPELELVMAALPILIQALEVPDQCADSQQKREANDEVWVVLDSCGEEEYLDLPGDEDLECFLDQLPLKAVVSHAIGLISVSHSPSLSGVDILKLFGLADYSLNTLGNGLQKYGSRRYPHFCKRIAILVHHLIHLVTDVWDFFKSSKHYDSDPAMRARIEVEYEALFIRAIGYFFQSVLHNIGWEMLSQLPFKYLSVHAHWHLLAVFHRSGRVDCSGDINIPQRGIKGWVAEIKESCPLFDASIFADSEEVACLLLTAMKNMAVASEDVIFAQAVALDIFRIGHLTPQTRGTEITKMANSLMASVFSKHPSLFSILIGWLKEVPPEVDMGVLDLFQALPTYLWHPSKTDLKLLSSWILGHDPQSAKNALSRMIISVLPWRGSSKEEGPLPIDVTLSAAAVALEACLIWDSKGRIPSAMRSESVISAWSWSLVSVLCIHPLDRKHWEKWVQETTGPDDPLLEVVPRGLEETHPLASLLSVLATEWGHSWSIAKEHAFPQLCNVAAHGKHASAISALYLILPLFVDHSDDLINCQNFQKLFLILLFADRTYVKMAKNLLHHEFPGPVLSQLGNMVVSGLENSYRFDASMSTFAMIWVRTILQVPNWKNEKEALYLLDIVLRSVFLDSYSKGWEDVLVILSKVTEQNMLHIQHSQGTFSSIMNLLARGPAPGSPRPLSLMAQSSFPDFPWFVLTALELEEMQESFLWDQLQIEYRAAVHSLGKFSLDSIIKSACQTLGLLPFSAAYLCIYRWARQALDTPLGHPALLLIWARFFTVYNKLFSCSDQTSTMLFEGSSFTSLLSQMKRKLNESVEWYSKEAGSDGVEHETALWLRHCSRIFHTFTLLLENGQQSYHSPSYSPQYSPHRIRTVILYENKKSWQKEFVDIPQIKSQIASALHAWDVLRGDFKDTLALPDYGQSNHYSPPLQRIHSRLRSCTDPFPLPFPANSQPLLRPEHTQIVCGKEATSKAVVTCLKPLLEYARLSSLHFSEQTALDCAFLELIPNLYQDVWVEFTRKVHCHPQVSSDGGQTQLCSSPAKIHFKVKESKMCRDIWVDMENNEACRKRLVTSILTSVPLSACSAGVFLENLVRELVLEKKSKHDHLQIQESALYVLNLLLGVFSEEAVIPSLPAKKLFTSYVETLVQEFVLGNEQPFLQLLSQMLENPNLAGVLSPLLTPTDLSTRTMIQAYGVLIKHLPKVDKKLTFVLLSKFEVKNWLSQQLPLKQDRLVLVRLIIDGITCCSSLSSDDGETLVFGLLQRHLRLLVIHNFPEILVEVLEVILSAIGDRSLQPQIWYDFLDTIVRLGCLKPSSGVMVSIMKTKASSDQWSNIVKEFSMDQQVLSQTQVKNSLKLLAAFFCHERLHFGLHGLYPKYRLHMKPIAMLLELLGCSFMAVVLKERTSADLASNAMWVDVRDMYAPWLLPYWEDDVTGRECTQWILEFMNSHPPLTPWIPCDSPHAKDVAASFSRCLQFMIDIAPGHHNSLGLIWEMYCSSFARSGVGNHVLEVIHSSLLMLPWDKFWPTIKNLKDMVAVAESSPLECRFFLCAIVPSIPWKEWTDALSSSPPLSAQALSCFLRVLLLISSSAMAAKDTGSGLLPLLVGAQSLSWHNLRASDYSTLLDLYLTRANLKAVLSWYTPGDSEDENIALLKLLKSAGGLGSPMSSEVLHQKCVPFLHAVVKLLVKIIGSEQYDVSSVTSSADAALLCLLQELERLVTIGPVNEEMEQVKEMAEVIKKVLFPVIPEAPQKFVLALSQAIAPRSPTSSNNKSTILCAKGFLLGLQSVNHSHMLIGVLIESAIETSLLDKRNSFSPLENMHQLLQNEGDSMISIVDGLSSAGHLLTLLAYLHSLYAEDLNSEKTYNEYLYQLVHRWLPALTITDDVEAKIPLLWAQTLILADKLEQLCPKEKTEGPLEELSMLALSLLKVGDEHEGVVSSLLGVVGLKRKTSPSKRFQVMCLTFSAFVFSIAARPGVHESHLKESLLGVEKISGRYKEFREVYAIISSAIGKSSVHSFLEGIDLLSKVFSRLYPEKPGYIQCMK